MTAFAQAWPGARAKLDRIFGGSVQILPMVTSQRKGPQPDPARAPVTVRAKFTLKPDTVSFQGTRTGSELDSFGTRQVADAELSIAAAVWATIPYALAEGDQVVVDGQPGQGRYSIAKIKPFHLGHRVLALVAEEQP
jgi:hypothetical protein